VTLAANGFIHLTELRWPLERTGDAFQSRARCYSEQEEITELANRLKLVLQAKNDAKSSRDRGIITTMMSNCFHFN